MTASFILHSMRTDEIVFQSEGTFHCIFFFLICIKDFNSMSFKPGFQFHTSGDHLAQYLAECRFSYSRLLSAMSSWVLTIPMTSLGNICQYSITFYCMGFWVVFFFFSSLTRISCISICAQIHFSFTFLKIFFENLPMKYSYNTVAVFLFLNILIVMLSSSVSYLTYSLFFLFSLWNFA